MPPLTARTACCAVWLTVVVVTGPAGAQWTPAPARVTRDTAPPTSPAVPKTPAGDALRAWLDAFNSGDSVRIAAFLRTFAPDRAIGDVLRFRQATGGFALLTIERSEPRHITFTLQRERNPTTVYGELELTATDPPRTDGPMLQALGPGVTVAALGIDSDTRRRVIDRAAALIDSLYVFPDVARRMGDSLRARLARGAYDGYTNGMTFARALHRDLREIANDRHLDVMFSARPFPPRAPEGSAPRTPSAEERARLREALDENNCGFDKLERLDGNVGYLKFDTFEDPDLCGATAAAAMTFLAGTRALVIDLRENGGGTPGMVALVASYVFDQRTHLNDLWTRHTGQTQEFWTQDSVRGRRFGGTKPVYVLTSTRTFSGAEEFAYDLQALGRAAIVGETTGGGAHPVRLRRIDDHFAIGVPYARAINPVTRTNWEGIGVAPDVKVPAGEALETALRIHREKTRP